MGKLTELEIRNLIKAGERFDGYSDGDGLYLRYRIEPDIKPSISKLAGGEVRQKHIDTMLKSIVARDAPTMAADVMRWTKRMFDYAVKREMVPYNMRRSIHRTRAVKMNPAPVSAENTPALGQPVTNACASASGVSCSSRSAQAFGTGRNTFLTCDGL